MAESEEQPYLIAALHAVSDRLGGLTRSWRYDRMATVCHPGSGELTASFAEAAKYYAVSVSVCPSHQGWRKGVVEKANHSAAQRWWRTLPDDLTPAQAAQARLDAWCGREGDARAPGSGTDAGPPSGKWRAAPRTGSRISLSPAIPRGRTGPQSRSRSSSPTGPRTG